MKQQTNIILAAVALTALWAALASPAPAAPAREGQEAAEPAETATVENVEVTPDGQWLTDDSGEQYRISKVPKVEGAYKMIEGNKVLLPLGVRFEVLKDDDSWFWVKEPKPVAMPAKTRQEPQGPTPEELAEIAARYQIDLPSTDRLGFEDFGRGLPRIGQWRNGFDVADMNGDGQLDVVFGPARKGRMVPNVFLGDGNGNWRPWSEARYPNAPYDYGDLEAADFNGDGHMDMAFGIHLRGLVVIVGDGKGGFSLWSDGIDVEHPGRGGDISAFSSRAVDSIDWNGDGKLDVLAFGEGPKGTGGQGRGVPNQVNNSSSRGFLVYLNKGDGSWVPWRPLQGENLRPNFGDAFVVAHLNKDDYPDLVTASRQMGSQDVLRIGKEGGLFDVAMLADVPPRAMVSAVNVADLDGDGHQDVVLGYMNREGSVWRTGIDLLFGASDLTWKRRSLFAEETRRGITAVELGNLDGDGNLDMVALTGRGETWVFLGDGKGGFVRETENLTPPELGCHGYDVHLVDLDGDGRDEILASFAGEPVGMPGIPGLNHPGCKKEGSVRAWKARPLS